MKLKFELFFAIICLFTFEFWSVMALIRPISTLDRKVYHRKVLTFDEDRLENKNFRNVFFSKDNSDTPQSRRWGGFQSQAQFFSLEKITSQTTFLAPLLLLTSFVGGVAYYTFSHHWNFAMSLYYATQAIMGEMYDVPLEDRALDQAFSIGLRIFGSVCVAGAVGNFGASILGRDLTQDVKKSVDVGDLNNKEKFHFLTKIKHHIDKIADTIGWFDHKTKYMTIFATLAWFAVGVWYEVAVDGVDVNDALVFIGGSLSEAGITGPPCMGGDEVSCAVPTDLSYFLTGYLMVGVPLFAATMGQFAQLMVEKAVRAEEAMRVLAPITAEEYVFVSRISDNEEHTPGLESDENALDCFAANQWQLDFGEFVIMNLLRLHRLDTDEISFFGRMFKVMDLDQGGAISRDDLRANYMLSMAAAKNDNKREAVAPPRVAATPLPLAADTAAATGAQLVDDIRTFPCEGINPCSVSTTPSDGSLTTKATKTTHVAKELAGLYVLAPLLLVGTLITGTLYYFFKLHWTLPTSLFYSMQVVLGHNYGVPSLPSVEDSAFTLGLHTWASVFLAAVLGIFASGFVRSTIRTGRNKIIPSGPIDVDGGGKLSFFERVAHWKTELAGSINVDRDKVNGLIAMGFAALVGLGTLFCTTVEGWEPLDALIFTVGAISSAGEPAPPCIGGNEFTCAIDPPLAYFLTFFMLTGVPLFIALLGQFSSFVLDKAIRTDEINKIFSPVTDEEFARVGMLSGALTESSMEEIDMGEFVVMMALRLGRVDEAGLAGMRELFNSLDTSGDGLVSFNEMRARFNCDNEKCWL